MPDRAKRMVVYDIPPTSKIAAYRVVRVDAVGHPDLADSFRSHFELQRRPRGLESTFVVIHMGVSCWRTEEGARALAQAYPKIGNYIAHLTLRGSAGFNTNASANEMGGGQHLTIWGDPVKLAASVVDVVPV